MVLRSFAFQDMLKKKRTEEELRKTSVRLFLAIACIIYLLTPGGRESFTGICKDFLSLFRHL